MADSCCEENGREGGERGALCGNGDSRLRGGEGKLMDVVETPGVHNRLDRKSRKRIPGANHRLNAQKTA